MDVIEKNKTYPETNLVDVVINKDVKAGLQCLRDNYIDMIITSRLIGDYGTIMLKDR